VASFSHATYIICIRKSRQRNLGTDGGEGTNNRLERSRLECTRSNGQHYYESVRLKKKKENRR
jgi:hypothetical protein